jgi:hypothetical protein
MSFLKRVLRGKPPTPEEIEARLRQEETRRRQEEEARVAAAQAESDRVLGPDLAAIEEPTTPDEAKLAIKLVRLRKQEIQAEKKALAAELADVREEWRDRQAGRYSTRGMGRGMGGKIVRASIQANRRSERMGHAQTVNQFSDQRQELDEALRTLDLLIVKFERIAISRKQA